MKKLLGDIRSAIDYAQSARAFLREPVTLEQAHVEIRARLASRDKTFLDMVRRGIYARPETPYAKLLQYAGVEEADLSRLVDQTGVEGTLERLYDAGVYLSVEELKGRRPVKRGGLEFEVRPSDLANPFRAGHAFTVLSSGSTGQRTGTGVDFNYARDQAVYLIVSNAAHGVEDRPTAHLNVAGPSPLFYGKIGRPMAKYFSVVDSGPWKSPQSLGLLRSRLTLLAIQLAHRRLTNPEFSRHDQTARAAEWLADMKRRGTPAVLAVFASPAVRVCMQARRRGLDISGSVMRVAGEPLTPTKAKVLAEAGVKPIVIYVTSETGNIGFSCVNPRADDDVHFLTDRVAVIQRPKRMGSALVEGALVYSTVSTGVPRLLLNAESGDYAELEQRDCDCPLGHLGLTTHLSGIRSYEKLTSEGVTFLGTTLHHLLEEVLPARFGGTGLDYQFVEEEQEGVTRASVVVSLRVGEVDESEVIACVVETLRSEEPHWTNIWVQNETLRVVRREPYATATTKVLPLHRVLVEPSAV